MSADTPPISEIETKVMQYTHRFKIQYRVEHTSSKSKVSIANKV